MTENHGFNVPENGTVDWHIPLNENFESLDKRIPIIDAEQNRDQYTPNQNGIFIARDTGRRFVGDGTMWTELPYPSDRSNTKSVISDFETNDLTAWRGETSRVRFTSDSFTGSQAITADPGDAFIYSLPGDGLSNYFPTGRTATYHVYTGTPKNVERIHVVFGVKDAQNFYRLIIAPQESNFHLRKVINGTQSSPLAGATPGYNIDTWYSIKITRDDGTMGGSDGEIRMELYEEPNGANTLKTTTKATDTDLSNAEGVGIYFDNIETPAPTVDHISVN